ncbi:GNAT family N-acetyltransferase [Stenotrophomonas sp. Iso1]|uniref:GNAT family N-acetyltransferase n=1 Tax=Stenotrophomonas sp. Iso1 TaxID=2977283 RepID=UPI0022B772EE|nr:GNAT family N-acetyltransferase [Stenotrophomonas sp. Iso1]
MRSCAPQQASAQDITTLCERLLAFNRKASGHDFNETPLQLACHDTHGQLCAGLLADICAGWLSIHVLWVDPEHRGSSLGTALLAEAEQQARTAGAHSVLLDTFDWQAEGFYLRQGYSVFGRLDDYPPGHQRIYLRKSLQASPGTNTP